MSYSYNDFLNQAQASGLLGEFSAADLETAKRYPEFGMSILNMKKGWHGASTPEQKLLFSEGANQLRGSYNNYSGGKDGGSFISGGKIPGQIDSVLDQMQNYGSFAFEREAPEYDSQYAQQQQALLDAVLNRPDFTWSKETDPLYATYKKSYLREGDRATANALAQASAASGGRPSTAAVTAATQAGDYYAGQLNDIIPTLYQQAYDKYLNEYSMMLQDLGAVNTLEQMDYQKYLDQLGQYNTDRNFAYGQYLDDYSRLQGNLEALQSQDAADRAAAQEQYAQNLDRAALLAGAGDFSAYGALLGLSGAQTQALVDQYAREQGLTEQAAAMELANFFAGYGDYSRAAEMGVDTSYMEALQRAELEAARRSGSGGGSGGGSGEPDGGGGLTPEQQAAMDAFQNGDHSDGVIEALVQAGYTQAQLEAAGYTGDYFRDGGDYKTLKYRDLSDRGKQIADLIDSDGTTDYARAIDLIEALPDEDEQNYLLRLLESYL